jgi:hypothetical protein
VRGAPRIGNDGKAFNFAGYAWDDCIDNEKISKYIHELYEKKEHA